MGFLFNKYIMTNELLNQFIDIVKLKYNDYIIYLEDDFLLVIKDNIYLEIELKTLHLKLSLTDSEEDKIINDIQKTYNYVKRQFILNNICA